LGKYWENDAYFVEALKDTFLTHSWFTSTKSLEAQKDVTN
jgi:hypothetical protein